MLSLLLLLACGTVEPPDDTAVAAPSPSEPSIYSSGFTGTLVDETGAPVAGLRVTLCHVVCLLARTDEAGFFAFNEAPSGWAVFENFDPPGDFQTGLKEWTRVFDFVQIPEDDVLVSETPYVIHRVPLVEGPLTGEQLFEGVAGLSTRVDADVLSLLASGAEQRYLGAVELPPEVWPVGGLGDWTIERAFSWAVWDLAAEDAFSVRVTLEQPLAPGTPVGFLVADYLYAFEEGRFFFEEAELLDDGSVIATPAGGGLDRSTLWLAVSQPVN